MDSELIQTYMEALPGFDLVANKEIAIPYYLYNTEFLYSDKRALPILQEYVLEFSKLGISKEDMPKLLGLSYDLILNAYYSLVQSVFIDYETSQLTEIGEDYLKSKSIDKLERGEYSILINSITSDIDVNVSNSILRREAKQYYCYKAKINSFSQETLNFNQMHKVLKVYCEKNELDSESKLIDIINLTKKDTRYRKVEILFYQNSKLDVRINVIENGKKIEKYEKLLYDMDADGQDLLKTNVGNFFEDHKVNEIYSFIDMETISNIEFYDFFTSIDSGILVLPLIENSIYSSYLIREIKSKLDHDNKLLVIVCGDKYQNTFQENIVNDILLLQRKKKNLHCIHILNYLPLMCLSKDYSIGFLQILRQNSINLKSTKKGIVSYNYNLSQEIINKIRVVEPSLDFSASVVYNPKCPILPKMSLIYKLWIDFDTIFNKQFDFSIFPDDGIKDRAAFLSIEVANDKIKFNEFLNIINKSIFESIKSNAKHALNDKNFFWNDFKTNFQNLYKTLDKVRVYRNKVDHIELDSKNEKLYYTYLQEDLDGHFIEFVPSGYKFLQAKLLSDMEHNLREIIEVQ